ncbi:MAG: 5-(carboxyamino)imidazole ribonucleotide synthase [Planctomycetota bacterium]|jgi:5-(carboxyamino)imidazole ribonucleotide synthase
MRIGVIGGGQLGRMLAQAGIPMGHTFSFYDSNPNACAREYGDLTAGAFDDPDGLGLFASEVDVVTCEFENVPADSLDILGVRLGVFPSGQSFRVAQDRLLEKRCFEACGVLVGPYTGVESDRAVRDAVSSLGAPGLLKARSGGYDGKGQARVGTPGDAEIAWDAIDRHPALYETRIEFARELSVIGVRSREGNVSCYPLIENVHRGGILIASRAPAPGVSDAMRHTSERYFRAVSERLGHVGVMAVELFDCGQELLANEMAPRVHNTGHWSIEGSETSQFENHVRAITGVETGSTRATGHSLMLNVLGAFPEAHDRPQIDGVAWHNYAKRPRPGRKVGHVCVSGSDPQEVRGRAGMLAGRASLHEHVPGLDVVEELLRED